MDFPRLSRQYANDGVGLMIVPAFDFTLDGWSHGRIAVMRGVEGGFSIARSAKQSILYATDDRGRILGEQSTMFLPFATVITSVPVHHDVTLYSRWGDWFAWLNIALLAGLLASSTIPSGPASVRIKGAPACPGMPRSDPDGSRFAPLSCRAATCRRQVEGEMTRQNRCKCKARRLTAKRQPSPEGLGKWYRSGSCAVARPQPIIPLRFEWKLHPLYLGNFLLTCTSTLVHYSSA